MGARPGMCSCFSDPTPGALQPNPRRDNHWDFSSVGPVERWLLSATVLRGIVTCAPQLEEEKHSYQATGRFKISGPDPPSAASSHWTASESHLETRCLDTSVCYGDSHLEGSKTCGDAQSAGFGESGKVLKIQYCALACPGWEASEGGMGLSIYPGLRTGCHKLEIKGKIWRRWKTHLRAED